MYLELKHYAIKLLCRYKVYFLALFLIGILAGVLSIYVNFIIKEIIDTVIHSKYSNLPFLLMQFGICKLIFYGRHFITRLFDIRYRSGLLQYIIQNMYTTVTTHPLYWFDSKPSGEISHKIADFQESICALINFIFKSTINFSAIIISIYFLSLIHYRVTYVMTAFILIYSTILSFLFLKHTRYQKQSTISRYEAMGVIHDSIANILLIKVIGNALHELKHHIIPAVHKWGDLEKITAKYDACYVDCVGAILLTAVGTGQLILSAYLYKNNLITAGDFVFIAITTHTIQRELDSLLSNILFGVADKMASISAAYNFLNNERNALLPTRRVFLDNIKGEVSFQNITFQYPEKKQVFRNFSLHIQAGQKIAIVGKSGAGKTTLIKCILRYFDPEAGKIQIDGVDITSIDETCLRHNISIISQDVSILHRSILDNLKVAKPSATIEEIIDACKKTRIHDDIAEMKLGYDTIVGERGAKLSGGQKQRIAIARAILKNAPIMLLDEATSSLDTATESLIQESINQVLQIEKITVIVIAHRLSTIQHIDRIIVIDNGTIVGDGRHFELLKSCVTYKELWDNQ